MNTFHVYKDKRAFIIIIVVLSKFRRENLCKKKKNRWNGMAIEK